MVHALFVQSLPFLGGAAVAGAANLYATSKQRDQNLKLAMFNAHNRREEMEVSRRHRQEELIKKYQLDRDLAAEGHAWRQEWETMVRYYPFDAGPGQLATSVDLAYPELRADQLPIVIIEQVIGDGTALWKNLHIEARIGLADLQRERLLYAANPNRAVGWPNTRLREHDLDGRPAIIVTPEVGADRLHLSVGGCNLINQYSNDVLPMTPLLTIEFRHSSELQRFRFSPGFNDRSREMTLVPFPRFDENEFNTHEAAREYVKLGAAAINLLVTRLVDHYHLAHRYGYAPRFEKSLRLLEARASQPDSPSLIQQTELPEIPELAIADVPYYRLTRALGSGVSQTPDETVATVARSLAGLGGTDHPTDMTSVVRLLRGYVPELPEEGTVFREVQQILNKIPKSIAGRKELLDAVDRIVERLQEKKAKIDRQTGPRPKWS